MEGDRVTALRKRIQHKQPIARQLYAILLQLCVLDMEFLHHRVQLLQLITLQIQQLSVLQAIEMLLPAIGTQHIQQLLLLNIAAVQIDFQKVACKAQSCLQINHMLLIHILQYITDKNLTISR